MVFFGAFFCVLSCWVFQADVFLGFFSVFEGFFYVVFRAFYHLFEFRPVWVSQWLQSFRVFQLLGFEHLRRSIFV